MSDGQGGSDFTPPTDDTAPPAPPVEPTAVDAHMAAAEKALADALAIDDPADEAVPDGEAGGSTIVDGRNDQAVDPDDTDLDDPDLDDTHPDGEEYDSYAPGSVTASTDPGPGAGRTRKGTEPQAAPTGGLGPGAQAERFGHQVRQYLMGVSGAALALAWARQENAPHGATVVVEREVSPLGRLGKMWSTPPESTLSCAIVLRPPLSVEEADATWLLAGLAAAEGAEAASGRKLSTWWPDLVMDVETGEPVAALKVEIQLGPGKVRSAVASIRMDLEKLGIGPDGRDGLLESVLTALDRNSEGLDEGSVGVAAAYDSRCGLLGRRVKLRLLPKGETRGLARRVDRTGRLELESATGMLQRIAIDNLRELEAV